MALPSIDVSQVPWVPRVLSPKVEVKDKITIFHLKSRLLAEQNINCLCTAGECRHTKCRLPSGSCTLEFIKRIGSTSVEGEVYHVKLNDQSFAFKLLPILKHDDVAKNKNEIRIASLVSETVLAGLSVHFPIVYASGLCANVRYFKGSSFTPKTVIFAIERALQKAMILKNKSRLRRLQLSLKDQKNPMVVVETFATQNPEDLSYPNFLKFLEQENYEGNYLCSQLAWGDLNQYLQGGYAKTSLSQFDLLIGMIESINDLQRLVRIVHGDLHLGNFLVQLSDGPLVLMHDFGKSQVVEKKWTTEDRVVDLEMMLSSLESGAKVLYLTPQILKLIAYLLQEIEKYRKAGATYNLAEQFLENEPTWGQELSVKLE